MLLDVAAKMLSMPGALHSGNSIVSQFVITKKTCRCASAAIIVPLKWPWFPPSLLCLEVSEIARYLQRSIREQPIAGTQESNAHTEKSELEYWLYTQVQR